MALKYGPRASELMDSYILECTKANIEQWQNRFFLQGDPGAILAVEFGQDSEEEVKEKADALQKEMELLDLGHHFPQIKKSASLSRQGGGSDSAKV